MQYGAEEVLQREYGDYATPVEPGFDFSVLVDLENLPEGKGMVGVWSLGRHEKC